MLIGLCGKKQHGKDTIANHLASKHQVHRYAFADPVKDVAKLLFFFNDDQLYGGEKEIPDESWFGLTPRQVFQFIGTECMRKLFSEKFPKFGENFWLLHLTKRIEQAEGHVIVTDIRFQNEFDLIKDMGGIIIKVERNIQSNDDHESEKNIDDIRGFDHIIKNDGTLEELCDKIDSLNLPF